MINMENKYIIYHIPGKKIGVTKDLYNRVTVQQGYEPGEYEVLDSSDDILYISERELELQDEYGYKVDIVPYNKLSVNKKLNNMKINVTEQTTTFPCPVNKLKGQLADNLEMTWSTEFGDVKLDKDLALWISNNAKTSMFNKDRCYVYNKAMSRYINNQKNKIPFPDVDGCEFSMFCKAICQLVRSNVSAGYFVWMCLLHCPHDELPLMSLLNVQCSNCNDTMYY